MKDTGLASMPPHMGLIWPERNDSGHEHAWSELAFSMGEQRLRPLLHGLRKEQGWPVPPEIAQNWEKAYQRSAIRNLKQKAELIRILRWLGDAGIPAIVLKGGAIVWRGWFDPAVRPMRDLDILVAKDHAADAHRLLRAHGFKGLADDMASVRDKHLPGLVAPETDVLVEIHTHVLEIQSREWEQRDDVFVSTALARVQQLDMQNTQLLVFSDEDILLHVIAHAVLDHQFNNGPLSLFDMEMLIKKGVVDWSNFWSAAGQAGLVRSAQLALRLAETVIPDITINWCQNLPENLDNKAITGAANLMFTPYEQRTELGFLGRLMRFSWSDQPRIFINNWLRRGRISGENPAARPTLRQRIANMSNKAGRAHIRQSLEIAKWLRK